MYEEEAINLVLLFEEIGIHSLQYVVTKPEVSVFRAQMNRKQVAVKIHKQEYLFHREIKSLKLL